ncbi:MAG: LamG domain-containing protein, partial [Sediminibacterium sp.]|nr:LamG domain-containing protein [Sediminibacterium sp.]
TNDSFASESFTINAWFRASTDVTIARMLISKEVNGGSPWNYRIYVSNTTGYLIGDIAQVGNSASIANSTNLADNTWHLASFSRDATTNTIKLY